MRRVLLAALALLLPAGIATGLWWSGAWVEPGVVDTVSQAEMAAREAAAKQTGAVPLDDETTEHLRQLGYIE